MKRYPAVLLLLLCFCCGPVTLAAQGPGKSDKLQVVAASSLDACDGEIDLVGEKGLLYSLYSVPEGAFEAAGLPFMDLCPGAYAIRACDADGQCRWLQEVVVPVAGTSSVGFRPIGASTPLD